MPSSALLMNTLAAAGISGVQPRTGLLPDWLDPGVLLRSDGMAPWFVLLVCGMVFAETGLLIGFFLPGDSLLFTAGLMVAGDTAGISIWLLALVVFVAAFAGDQLGYLIGRNAGPAIFKRPDSRLFRQDHLAKAHGFFGRFGGRAVILARFVPIVRTFTPVVAGVARMDYRVFAGFNAVGALLWGGGVTALGAWLGQFEWVGRNIDLIFIAVVLVSVVAIGAKLIAARRAAKPAAGPSAVAPANDDA
jgi:membrane-associated protein